MKQSSYNKNILTVSQISHQIRSCLESQFSSVWIKGELSNFIAHSSGHWYFSLKDESSCIKALMFRGKNQKIDFRPKNGMEILVQGSLSLYPPRGDYQILCSQMLALGDGSLNQKFEYIKNKLKQEGLFDQEHKQSLPFFPRHIAVITSPTGAAIRDILQTLKRRLKAVKITLIPALVQGAQAEASLLKALSLSKQICADLVILGRGGGSIEDLWAFNSEELARSVFKHPIPVISAVGHEIDFTICDFVADLRAATPSAAAERAVPNEEDLLNMLNQFKKQTIQNIQRQLQFFKDKLATLNKSLFKPYRLLQDHSQKLDELHSRLIQNLKFSVKNAKERLQNIEKVLNSLNPKKVLERGFSIVTDTKERIILDTKKLQIKDTVNITFAKGQTQARIIKHGI